MRVTLSRCRPSYCAVHGRIADGCQAARTVGVHSYDGQCAQLWRSVCTVGVSTDGHGRPHGRRFLVEVNGGAGRASRLADRRSVSLPGTRAAGTGPVTGVRLFPRRALPGRPPAPGPRRCPGRQRARRRRRMAAGGQCPFMRAITERDRRYRPGGIGSVPDPRQTLNICSCPELPRSIDDSAEGVVNAGIR